ncbi:hypothetical protein NDU88_008873 [Pleurodeles waltl]|uniref:Uncharacterized protein n=1 Tax=Pleurodeles waltl TaxID=8319 RepID=A0AAV7N7Q9_PLEWA|nr:hypothetical protein NDU88_008873 [Pleurodeles waltl]
MNGTRTTGPAVMKITASLQRPARKLLPNPSSWLRGEDQWRIWLHMDPPGQIVLCRPPVLQETQEPPAETPWSEGPKMIADAATEPKPPSMLLSP